MISHGTGGGYSKVDGVTQRENRVLGTSCSTTHSLGAGYKALRMHLYKWTGSAWGVCASTSYKYNSTTTYKLVQAVYWGSSPRCGNGYYGTSGGSWHYNGAWYGGSVWSGYHWLPA